MSFRAYARQNGIALGTLQDRIKRGTITESAIDRSGTWPKINSEIADRDFAARRSEIGAQSDAMTRASKLKPAPAPSVIDEMFGPEPTRPPVARIEKPEVITKMIDGKEVPVTQIPYAGEDNFDRYRKAKAGTEELKARKLEMEVDELEGRLVDKDEVKKKIEELVIRTRTALLNIPAKAAPTLVSIKNVVELEAELFKEINLALESLQQFGAEA